MACYNWCEGLDQNAQICEFFNHPPLFCHIHIFYLLSAQDFREEPNNDSWGETGPYRKSSTMYRPPNESLDSSSDEERKHKAKSRTKSRKKVRRFNCVQYIIILTGISWSKRHWGREFADLRGLIRNLGITAGNSTQKSS